MSVHRVRGRLVASVGDEPMRYDVADRRIGGRGARRGGGTDAILSVAVARTER